MNNIKLNDIAAQKHYLSIENGLRSRIDKILGRRFVGKRPNRVNLDDISLRFLRLLKREESLKKLITAKPQEIENLITFLKANFPAIMNDTQDLHKIFYNLFVSHGYNKEFDKYEFVVNINMNTCIYCNRSYTFSLDKASMVKPEIDHFYPTSIYPFLALSFYNLIPSCQTCNGLSCKRQQDPRVVGLVNPYLLQNSDFKFSYKINSIKVLNPLINSDSVSVVLRTKVKGNLNVFKLDKLYEKHSDHVLELIIKSKLSYTDKYRKYLKSYKRFNFSNQEIDRLIIGNYSTDNDINKRPLAKLYQDIARELGLIK